jgi:transcriptional regulator with XRE-family HTH domain
MAETKITGAQVRMARAALRWSIADLATNADVGGSTVQRIEADTPLVGGSGTGLDKWREMGREEALAKITAAFVKAGVTFLPDDGKQGPGIRAKAPKSRGK